MLTGDKM